MTAPPRPWQADAACGPATAHLFFPTETETLEERAVREADALAICRRCPVRVPCAQDALAQRSQHAVRGGCTPDQLAALRHAMLKRQRRAEGRAA